MRSLFILRLRLIRKRAVWIVSLIAVAAFLGFMYSIAPSHVCSSYLLSALFLYLLCIILSLSLQEKENDVFEGILYLHCVKERDFYLSREILLIGISLLYACVLAAFPFLIELFRPGFFTRPPEGKDLLLGGGVIWLSGLCGMELGDFFHPRIFTRRRNGIVGAILITVLGLCKYGMIKSVAAFKVLHLILPPFMDALKATGDKEYFDAVDISLILLHMLLFIAVITVAKIGLFRRKRFNM